MVQEQQKGEKNCSGKSDRKMGEVGTKPTMRVLGDKDQSVSYSQTRRDY